MKKRIYIAGKVTGEDREACTEKFKRAQEELQKKGFKAVNPLEVVNTWEITWENAMKKCIAALMEVEAVYLLPCVSDSPGAKLELSLAQKLGIPVCTKVDGFYQFCATINETRDMEVNYEVINNANHEK